MRTVAELQAQPQSTLWVDIQLDPPALAIRRKGGGLVQIDQAEVSDLITTLSLATLELQALKAETDDARTDEEKDADDRLEWLEWLHGTPDEPACPNCGVPMTNKDQRTGESWCYWCSARASAEFDDSPIAGEDSDVAGKPDDFYDGGEEHSDVW